MSEPNRRLVPVEAAVNAPVPQPAVRRSQRAGRANYSSEECVHFLSAMEEILPIGGQDWEAVLSEHSKNYPGREVDSLRRKFAILHRKSIPTGDPTMPIEVRMAKRIKYKIGARADVGEGEDTLHLADGSFSGGEDHPPEDMFETEPSSNGDSETGSEAGVVPPHAPPIVAPPDIAPVDVAPPDIAPVDVAPPAIAPPAVAPPAAIVQAGRNNKARPLVKEMRPRGAKSAPGASEKSEFIEMMKLQMLAESKSRQAFHDTLQSAMCGLATAFLNVKPPASRKRKRSYSTSSDEDE